MTIKDYRYEVIDDERVFNIKFTADVLVSDILLDFPILDILSIKYKGQEFETNTSIFIDKKSEAAIIRNPDRSMILIFGNKRLDVSFSKKGFLFDEDGKLFDFDTLSKEQKNALFARITAFMDEFSTINEYLPVEATKTFIFLQMGILNIRDVSVVKEANGVLLYLNPFRSLDLSKLRLNIADSTTYEVVGSIDAYLGSKDEDNFSYRGNVSYKISDEYTGCGYATKALAALIEFINEIGDEYNRELYIAALIDDIAYQMVALKNGAQIVYDGDVPETDSLRTLSKIRQIKIYKIANK